MCLFFSLSFPSFIPNIAWTLWPSNFQQDSNADACLASDFVYWSANRSKRPLNNLSLEYQCLINQLCEMSFVCADDDGHSRLWTTVHCRWLPTVYDAYLAIRTKWSTSARTKLIPLSSQTHTQQWQWLISVDSIATEIIMSLGWSR